MGDFRPRKLTIWVVFDVESESEVQNAEFLHLDRNLGKTIPIDIWSTRCLLYLVWGCFRIL